MSELLLALVPGREYRGIAAHSPHTGPVHCDCLSFSPSSSLPPAARSRRSGDTWQRVKAFYSMPDLSTE